MTAQPYLATALFALSAVEVAGLGTMAVDRRWRLYVDGAVLERWSVPQIGSVLVHEAHHLLRDHAGRAKTAGVGPEEADRWNVAADLEINDDLTELSLPPNGCFPAAFGMDEGQLAETYYLGLQPAKRAVWECGSGAHGVAAPWEKPERVGVDEGEAELIRQSVAEAVRATVRSGGKVSGGLERWAKAFLEPKVDWRRVLAAEIRGALEAVAGAVDYSYKRPSRRTGAPVGRAVVLPAMIQPVPRVAVIVDTSGSMTSDDLEAALGEVRGILRLCGARGQDLTVLAVDTAVHVSQRVFSADSVRLAGGGGTNMGVGLAAAAELRPRPQVAVVLTDGMTPWPAARPLLERVVVALIGKAASPTPSWARVVRISGPAEP